MQKAAPNYSSTETLELIQAQLAELRQTEALEAQIHEMVVSKRHRLQQLMTQFLELQREEVQLERVEVRGAPIAAPSVAASAPVSSNPSTVPSEPLRMTQLGTGGGPADLLAGVQPPVVAHEGIEALAGARGRGPAATGGGAVGAAPSAQQVLDSLNRLMAGLKEISAKQGPPGMLPQ
jgi:hypothetical protein